MVGHDLNYETHVEFIVQKLNKTFHAILKLKNKVNVDVLLDIYYAVGYSHLSYGVVLYL